MKTKIFLISFLISLPLWCGANILEQNLEQVFFIQEIKNNPQILAAQVSQQILEQRLRDIRITERQDKKQAIESLEINAESAISVKISKNNDNQKILFEKNSDKKLPIASLTKMITAYTVLENYDLDQIIEISKQAIGQEENFGNLLLGEKITARDLLYVSLIASSNDAAFALAEQIKETEFADLMNLETRKTLALENTYFVNSTGLDPDEDNEPFNYSTVRDLAKFTARLIECPLIFDILSQSEVKFASADGTFHHLETTNEFLETRDAESEKERPEWLPMVVAGKTGWTPLAQGCLILILELPDSDGYLINVILGSNDKFIEMEKMINTIWKIL